jgi:ATP-binding cassette subfamily C protein
MGRLLRLPLAFFRDYSVGDLADRALALVRIRQSLTGAATTALLSGLMALPAGLLLFYYDAQLALFALAFTALVMIVEGLLFLRELPRQRWVSETRGNVEGCTFETLSAMPKLRAAAAETRAFARWSKLFAEHSQARREAAEVETLRTTIAIIVPQFGTALVWLGGLGMIWGGKSESMPIGDFVAFQSAFALFITGILGLARGGQTLIDVVPEWERLSPILKAREENGVGRASPGPLRGEITISDVTFRYAPDLAPALQGLNLSIRSGEYVALAGASGSGKSTLIRLLLGLEQPQSGAIYVDGLDLATIDLGAMRRQIGVVLQTGQLPAGTLLEVILGSAPLPESQAWEAARQAGLDADIKAMPMGMQTVLSEGGGGLSGGQRQRVLIARALVRRPRVLIFDEATSALDNVTQAAVKHTLDRLNITRIVVAHRLSTIRNVHRVIVMDQGQVVEQGSFDELLAAKRHFADLAARQMA